jgi:hypothetical protein
MNMGEDCPRCGSDRVKDMHIPSRSIVTAPGTTGYKSGDRHEAKCLNCGWFSVHTYREGKGWELTDIASRKKR